MSLPGREIKFRAWDTVRKRMLPVVHIEWDWRRITHIDDGMEGLHEASGYVLMEFTGLRDRNGKDIYEGDIISRGDAKGVVWYCQQAARFQVDTKQAGSMLNFILSMNMTQSVVIGNVYENPGLVETK